jgi:hypothetical protein
MSPYDTASMHGRHRRIPVCIPTLLDQLRIVGTVLICRPANGFTLLVELAMEEYPAYIGLNKGHAAKLVNKLQMPSAALQRSFIAMQCASFAGPGNLFQNYLQNLHQKTINKYETRRVTPSTVPYRTLTPSSYS